DGDVEGGAGRGQHLLVPVRVLGVPDDDGADLDGRIDRLHRRRVRLDRRAVGGRRQGRVALAVQAVRPVVVRVGDALVALPAAAAVVVAVAVGLVPDLPVLHADRGRMTDAQE